MKIPAATDRLFFSALTSSDADFISELVNTEGWIRYIGDRNVHTPAAAEHYIKKIIENPDVQYWTVRLKTNQGPVGIITFIKRNYLDHHDIGFAFLPQYFGHGYAYEASSSVLKELLENEGHQTILATTVPANTRSVQLLKKLGLQYERALEQNGELLHVYSIGSR